MKRFIFIMILCLLFGCGGGGGSSKATIKDTEEQQVTINNNYSYTITAKITHIVYDDSLADGVRNITYELEIKDYEPDTNYFVNILVNGQQEYHYDYFGQLDRYYFQIVMPTFSEKVRYDIYDKRAGKLLLRRELDISNVAITDETLVETYEE